ncbi:MAG: tRNA uridine-5-carboxymethylaminomethyl(34) synthesis GTPase MnmE [Sulfitobacter sp.]
MDTIFALATATGRSGVAVIRISGPSALEIGRCVAGSLPGSHCTAVRLITDDQGALIDQALVLPFHAPRSFTGEDVVELHLHGSIAVVAAVLDRLDGFSDARLAEAGEFTRRALENEKLDLAQVEGLADLIDAETELQRKQALRVLSGHLGNLVEGWRADLIRAAALLEATIDFADEDVPVDVTPEVMGLLEGTISSLQKEVEGGKVAERIRLGFEVAIVGAPNAGKSTLLNHIAGREAAITSEFAGTTRDVVEVRMNLNGLPVTFLDTAGLRESDDVIETIGIERAIERASMADLRIFLVSGDDDLALRPLGGDIVVRSKADLGCDDRDAVSGKTGQGVERLISNVSDELVKRSMGAGLASHVRHRVALETAVEFLTKAQDLVCGGVMSYDIVAEELRFVIRSLENIVGRVGVEDLLDEIFSSFCIGK